LGKSKGLEVKGSFTKFVSGIKYQGLIYQPKPKLMFKRFKLEVANSAYSVSIYNADMSNDKILNIFGSSLRFWFTYWKGNSYTGPKIHCRRAPIVKITGNFVG